MLTFGAPCNPVTRCFNIDDGDDQAVISSDLYYRRARSKPLPHTANSFDLLFRIAGRR